MTHKTTFLLLLILSFSSCKLENETKNYQFEKLKSNKIDSLANRYLELNRFSGIIVVSKNEAIVYSQSFGMADYENSISFSNTTAFKIGEITELITDNILNGLVEEGKLKLSDRLSKHLVGGKSDITINDFIKQNSEFKYNIIGRLIEKISGKSYQQNIEDYSNTLGLENTFFKKKKSNTAVGYLYHNNRGEGLELQASPTYNLDAAYSSTGIKSTGSDVIKILKYNVKDVEISGYLDTDGFSYSVVNDTKSSTSIVVLSNRKQPITEEMSSSIAAILEGKDYRLPLSRQPVEIDYTTLKGFEGKYAINENAGFEVHNTNDSLFVFMGPNKIYLIPQSSNQFYMEDVDAAMRFIKDTTGVVNRIMLLDGFIDSDQSATRIK